MQTNLDQATKHLAQLGIQLKHKLNPTLSARDLDAAQKQLGLELPDSYIQFVTQFANGFELVWEAKGEEVNWVEMFTLDYSIEGTLSMRDWRFYSEEKAREYGFPYVDDSELALETNRRMHNWLPLFREGNGDLISIDLNQDGFGRAIFDQNNWLDGGTGHNGFPMAADLPSFIQAWGQVCFAYPKDLWWKSVLGDDGVNWDSDQFDDRYRLKG